MPHRRKAISTINDLIETLKDGEKGFQEASEAVTDPHLKSLFEQYSQQRHRFVSELQGQAESLDESKLGRFTSTVAALHRAWISFKSTVTTGDDNTILREVERGEGSALHQFEEAMEDGLTGRVREIVSRQFIEIKHAYDRVKYLRNPARRA